MAKGRKTRKEKVSSDLRRHTKKTSPSHSSSTPSSEAPLFSISPSTSPSTSAAPQEYAYLSKDLTKTALLTSGIVIVELILAFAVKI